MLVVGFLGVKIGGWLWPPPVFTLVRLLTVVEIDFSSSGSGTLILFTLLILFEQIIVFQAGVRRNTLAWNNL